MATLVRFMVHPSDVGDLYAYFPRQNYHPKNPLTKCGYAHIGQHTPISVDYIMESRPATPEEYAALKAELEQIGYKLKVCKY